MRYKYEIDEDNAIKIWDLENPNEKNAPFLYQPDWPNLEPWESKEQAEEWVLLLIESMENPESTYVPGNSPAEPKILRPETLKASAKQKLIAGEPLTEAEADTLVL